MNISAAKIFSRVVLAERQMQIKLLGDSITHGAGGTGYEQSGDPIVEGFARNPDGYCWAKQFKEHMEGMYGCRVINNGCSGTTIEFIIEHFDELVDKEDDIILCTIGTNNRHQMFEDGPKHTKREHMDAFYQNIIKLNNLFKSAGKDVIFVANIPASASDEQDGSTYWRIFHMNDVNDMYLKAASNCGFPFISMYEKFMEYCDMKDISVDSLLADGLHPNDAGYDVMFKLLMKELGIARKVAGAKF